MGEVVLRGITWGHSRGITPLLAVSQRFHERNPAVRVQWNTRSLQEFADFPIEKLTEEYDLLIIDHPWVGCAAATGCVIPLNDHLPEEYLSDQLNSSVGLSHLSYKYSGAQWALAVDAATPVASYRADLFSGNNQNIPETWEDLISLAKKGRVAVPAIPVDLLMNFYTFCIAAGEQPFQSSSEVISREAGFAAISRMQELYANVNSDMFRMNPIAVAEAMTSGDDYWYCPFAYGYSNYSRKGYAKNLLQYADPVLLNGHKLITTIGGTGIAVSAYTRFRNEALEFASMVASPISQSGIYVQNGGQPAHLSAWSDETANYITNNFFTAVLPAMERGYMRPRYNGYLYFQDQAGETLHRLLGGDGSPDNALDTINAIYRQSIIENTEIVSL